MLNNPTERKVAMISLPMNGLTREAERGKLA